MCVWRGPLSPGGRGGANEAIMYVVVRVCANIELAMVKPAIEVCKAATVADGNAMHMHTYFKKHYIL